MYQKAIGHLKKSRQTVASFQQFLEVSVVTELNACMERGGAPGKLRMCVYIQLCLQGIMPVIVYVVSCRMFTHQ